jgi:lantibiotic modifying enzyme
LGSIIYSFAKISQFLNEPSLLDESQQFATWITPAHIAFDQKRDIVQGAAGAILGLLSLHQLTGNPAILDKAVMCGRYLVENRVSTEGQAKAWQGIADKPLTGFSHGAAGIAYALLRLYQIAPEPTFLQAAQAGIAFERSKFFARTSNPIDFHLIDQDYIPGFRVRWCYGVPGIALARLGGLPVLDTDTIRQEIDSALQVTQDAQLGAIDHLCCGDFGLIETLLSAAQKLDRPDISEKAQRRAAY